MRMMMGIGVLTGVAMAVAGCAGSATPEQRAATEQAQQEAIADILSTPLSAEEYGAEARCLSAHAYRSVDVLDDRHVLFKGSGDKLWINELRQRCIGLRADDVLQMELRANRLCDLDTFQGIDSFSYWRTSGTCTLGTFTQVTPDQVDAIKLAMEKSAD